MPIADLKARREYQRQWRAARRAKWFEGKSCATCGATDELELDHIDPKSKVTHAIWSWSAERREAELSKCQVLCRMCHRDKSIRERKHKAQHGSLGMYNYNACRCDKCRAAHTAYVRAYRAKKSIENTRERT